MDRHEMRERRLELKLSQAELGRRVGVTGKYLGLVERGIENPSAELWANIERVLWRKKKERTAEEQWWHELWVKRYEW